MPSNLKPCSFLTLYRSCKQRYGKDFSKIQEHFLTAVTLARNNKKKVTGIVINAFTEPFVIPEELFDIIAEMDSAIEPKE